MSGPVAHPHAEKILSLILHDDRDVALQGVELARSLDDPDLLEAIAGSSYVDPTHGTLGVGRPLSRIVDEGLRVLVALRFVLDLVALGLYVEPLNAVSRGGRRFIFHAAALAHALTEALRPIASTIVPGWLWGQSFHVNPVFRCNRFEPGDAPFRRHHDAPYHDPAQRHISHHTLLLYLTGGRGDPALCIDDARIDALAPLAGALFDQRYAHEGAAYLDETVTIPRIQR